MAAGGFFSLANGGFIALLGNGIFILIAIILLVCYLTKKDGVPHHKLTDMTMDEDDSENDPMIDGI
eukprot:CAMPEP_0197025902 /NCGR_PEP_ID=MMETSP1384-20130603/6109_1 /TAXON_ID=29189 /ORGANISM="Ammonia sp." /LENGTH=65 /DNA_ID=CAMNT_0042454489 /DNA_START=21 /DNA_END=218 /DNA_ORIENTATION=+